MTCHITSSMYKTCPSMHVNEITGVAMILCNYRLWTKKRIIGHAKLTDFSYFPWNCRDSRSWIEWSRVISCYSARDKVTTRTRRIRGRHSCVKRNLIELRLTATVSTPTQNMGYLLDVNNGRIALSPNTFVCQTFNWGNWRKREDLVFLFEQWDQPVITCQGSRIYRMANLIIMM